MLKKYYSDIVDRMVKTAAQSAILSIGVESAEANALAFDWQLMAGMAAGGAVLSLLMNLSKTGLFGKADADE